MAKTYPLDVRSVGSDEYIVMSYGHHDPHEFMRKVRAEGYDWPLGMPEHKWARTVPSRNPEYNFRYVFCGPGERGAFPCTYAWEAYNDARYEAIVARDGSSEDKA